MSEQDHTPTEYPWALVRLAYPLWRLLLLHLPCFCIQANLLLWATSAVQQAPEGESVGLLCHFLA